MNRTKKSYIIHLVGVFVIVFLCAFHCPSRCWAATAKVDVIHSQDRYPAGNSYPIAFRIRILSPWYIHGTRETGSGLIPTKLSLHRSPYLEIGEIHFPPPTEKAFEYMEERLEVFSGEILVRARVAISQKSPAGEQTIRGNLSYQACSSKSCLPPEELPIHLSFMVAPAGTSVQLQNQKLFRSFGGISTPHETMIGWKLGASFWVTLLGVFLGGLALNLTPCIYPLIPITVSYFGGRSRSAREQILVHALLYISGLGVTNSTLGIIASLSGSMLGSVLQEPLVLLVVTGILVSLALSFFGIWELRLPSALMRAASKSFGGYFGTFFMGLTLGIVAAPCLGPFILGLLTFVGQKGDPFLGFLYFFVLSIGLGLPLSILAIFSSALEKLPRSGAWMVWIRKIFGWILLGMAAYFLQPLISGIVGKSTLLVVMLVAAGLHLGFPEWPGEVGRPFPYIRTGLGLVLIGGAILLLLATSRGRVGIEWIPYDPAVVSQAAQKGRPVILDFYADWCAPCVELDQKVFRDPEIVKLSREFVALRVDLTRQHTHQDELLKMYQVRGVPTIIFMNRKGVEERALRIESYVKRGEVLSKMRQLIEKP